MEKEHLPDLRGAILRHKGQISADNARERTAERRQENNIKRLKDNQKGRYELLTQPSVLKPLLEGAEILYKEFPGTYVWGVIPDVQPDQGIQSPVLGLTVPTGDNHPGVGFIDRCTSIEFSLGSDNSNLKVSLWAYNKARFEDVYRCSVNRESFDFSIKDDSVDELLAKAFTLSVLPCYRYGGPMKPLSGNGLTWHMRWLSSHLVSMPTCPEKSGTYYYLPGIIGEVELFISKKV